MLSDLQELESSDKDLVPARTRYAQAQKELISAKFDLDLRTRLKPEIIQDLKNKLHALDSTMSIHEIQIAPEIIPPIKTYKAIRYLNHGDITKLIYKCLAQEGMYTYEVVAFIMEEHELDIPFSEIASFQRIVRKRLRSRVCRNFSIESQLYVSSSYS